MEHVESEHRKAKDLKKGDIVFMRIPFEENTTDYYNGYWPKEIRGESYTDRFGDTSKPRFVVVIGRDSGNLIYLPLTSRSSKYDIGHQYTLQDNSMTVKRDPEMKSYVEISSLRAVHVKPDWDIQYNGRVAENDMINIMIKLGRQELDLDSKRDQRAYVSAKKESAFERRLLENGYRVSKDEFREKTYVRDDGRYVSKSKWGLVRYHVPLSKKEVAELVAEREGKPVNTFTKAVADITEKTALAQMQ